MSLTLTAQSRPLLPGRVWWLGLLAILVLAGALRFTGYNFSLPYVDHPDEPNFFLTALEWRGQYDDRGYLTGYPPVYIWLQAVAQIALGPFGYDQLHEAVGLFRLISILFSLSTVVLIALTARRIIGEWAGWSAGLAWAVAPLIVEHTVWATPDPLLYMLTALALWLAVESLYGRPRWAFWSFGAGCLAILDKYFVITAVLPGLLAALIILKRDRRLGWKLLGAQAVLFALTSAIAVAGILVLPREAAVARDSGLTNVLNPERVLNNLYYAIFPLFAPAVAGCMIAGLMAWWVAPRLKAQRAPWLPVLLIVATVLTIPWLAAAFSMVGPATRLKDVLPATVGWCILLGVALGQVVALFPERKRWTWGLLVGAVMLFLVWVPQVQTSWSLVQNRLQPDTRVDLRQWADEALLPGMVLVGPENHKTFNPFWGGIPANHWFDWIETREPVATSVEEWREDRGVSYAAIPLYLWDELSQSEAGQAWRNAVLPLRTFEGPSRGPEMVFARLWRPDSEVHVRFGDAIDLIGFDGDIAAAQPGDGLNLRFYWNAITPPSANYSVFVHLVSADGQGEPWAQADGAPASQGRPTLLWTDSSEAIISEPFVLSIPDDLAPGTYRIRIGLYEPDSGLRLPVTDSLGTVLGDGFTLGSVTVLPKA